MEATYAKMCPFEKKLYQYNSIKDLHFKLFNIMMLITHNERLYSFYDKYQGWKLNCNRGPQLCPLSQVPDSLSSFEEELDRNQFNLFNLKQFGFELFPFLAKYYYVNQRSLEAFSGHFSYPFTDRYTGEESETFFKFTTNIKKRNGDKK